METLKYEYVNTYPYDLDKERLDWLVKRTNRSTGQTLFLFQLVDGDFEKLKEFETKIMNSFYFGCPGGKEDVERVMNSENKLNKFVL